MKNILVFVVAIILAVGVIGYIVLGNIAVSNDKLLPKQEVKVVLKSGEFRAVDGAQTVKGNVQIGQNDSQTFVQFLENFDTDSVKDMSVWLVKPQELSTTKTIDLSDNYHLDLGKLVSKKGLQFYKMNPEDFGNFQFAVVLYNTSKAEVVSFAMLN
jgi:hypothetical protein